MSRPVVALVAHGTADPAGRAVLDNLRDAVADRLPESDVRLAFVDVIEPTPEQVLAGTSAAVLVPLFLSRGYHVEIDIAAAVQGADRAGATEALGADPLVVEAVAERVREVVTRPAAVVLAAAGSSRASARAEVDVAAGRLADRLGCPVTAAFLSGPGPTVADALAGFATHDTSSVVVAAHLLAPGHFHRQAARVAATHGVRCTEPIGVHPRVVDLVVRLATHPPAPTRTTDEEDLP